MKFRCQIKNKTIKNTKWLFCLLALLFLIPEITHGQTALSIDQNEANFGLANENIRGWVKSVKQRYYAVAAKKKSDEMIKESSKPIYEIKVFYSQSGNIERIEGPGFTSITNKYSPAKNLLVMSDKIGDYDQKHYRRITDYIYDNSGRLLEETESNIPYSLSGGKAVYNFRNPDIRTKTEYTYNSLGKISESVVYERQTNLVAVYKEQYFYDKSGLLSQKISTDREGSVSMKEDYIQGIRSKTEFINRGKINKRIIYDKKGRPTEDTGLGAGDAINTIVFKYDDEGKLVEWTCYDALGNMKEIYTGVSSPAYCVKETYQYDVQGNRVGWSFYDELGIIVDRYFTQCTYDKRGNWTRKATIDNYLGTDRFVIVEREIDYY